MFSLFKVALISVAALATFTSAAPVATPNGALSGVLADVSLDVPGTVAQVVGNPQAESDEAKIVSDIIAPGLQARDDSPKSLPDVVVTLTLDLDSVLVELRTIVQQNGIVDLSVVLGLLDTVEKLFVRAVSDVKGLTGLDLNTLLTLHTDVNEIINTLQLAKLISELLSTVSSIVITVVVAAGSGKIQGAVQTLLSAIITSLAQLLAAIFDCVQGLKEVIIPLTTGILGALKLFGLSDLVKTLVEALI